ncbi:hypothetical protein AAFF_G00259600 [Aldrovandia affinis]|uniref:Uncharacterized protein n=1 Tax=Aldrovandia affinis TaxID=143900 RepID=A0AAD7RC68_9TELE|nr:hypothetical protein AAFF_G00259600 [Aldrovandia affinis]
MATHVGSALTPVHTWRGGEPPQLHLKHWEYNASQHANYLPGGNPFEKKASSQSVSRTFFRPKVSPEFIWGGRGRPRVRVWVDEEQACGSGSLGVALAVALAPRRVALAVGAYLQETGSAKQDRVDQQVTAVVTRSQQVATCGWAGFCRDVKSVMQIGERARGLAGFSMRGGVRLAAGSL